MTAVEIVMLKINELRSFVRGLIDVENSKQLKRWIKTHWVFFKPYLKHLKYFSKDGLPSLRYKHVWSNLALAIQRIIKEQKIGLLVKQWEKMNKLQLEIEYLKVVQIPISSRKLIKADLISALKCHHKHSEVAA